MHVACCKAQCQRVINLGSRTMGEDVTLVQNIPVKIIAEILALITTIWLIVSIAGEEWVDVRFLYYGDRTWNWGVRKTCNELIHGQSVCVQSDWITVCLVFSIIGLILAITSLVCGGLGIMVANTDQRRTIFFMTAAALMCVIAFLELMVVIIFPAKFGEDMLNSGSVQRWDFDWTYGFAWGGLIFSVGSALFFFMPIVKSPDIRTSTTYYSSEYL